MKHSGTLHSKRPMASPANLQSLPEALTRLHLSPSTQSLRSHRRSCSSSPFRFDPQPDWTLSDLKDELEALVATFSNVPTLPQEHSATPASCVSWRQLSVVADFGRERRPFRISAFDDESDSDDDVQPRSEAKAVETSHNTCTSDGNGEGQPSSISGASTAGFCQTGPWLLPRTEIVEGSLFELERERLLRVQDEVRGRQASLETAIEEESNKSAAMIAQVDKEEELKHEFARRKDKQYQRSIAEMRDIHLSALQRDHEQRSQVEERKIRRDAAAEEARRREHIALEERKLQDKLKAEAEAKRKADLLAAEKLAAEAERRRQAEAAAAAALQRAELERIAKLKEEPIMKESTPSTEKVISDSGLSSIEHTATEPKPRVSDSAAKLELARSQKMMALLEVSHSLQANPDLKKDLKNCERNIIKILQQISATQQQVRIKSVELMTLLTSGSLNQAFSFTTLASKLMSQCEIQVLKLPSFAFALAQVVVNVSSQIPDLMDVVLAKLQEVCIFTVPKFYIFKKSQFVNERAYFKTLGYKEEQGKLESTDDYIARMNAYVAFYAAVTQTEVSGGVNTHGLKEGWAWCARLLNTAPAHRVTASVLESFLKIAGFRLYQVYRKAFMRMLQLIASGFIEKLKSQNDPDSRAVVNRIETYLRTQQFLQEPDGRNMPRTDMSSSLKA